MMRALLLVAALVVGARAYCFSPAAARAVVMRSARSAILCLAAEEEDEELEKAVAKAEKLWSLALAARQRADRLSSEAEALAEEVSSAASEEASRLKGLEGAGGGQRFSLSMLSNAKSQLDSSLDAGQLLSAAVEAAEEAEIAEALAEEALAAVEAELDE